MTQIILYFITSGDWHCAYVLLYGPKVLEVDEETTKDETKKDETPTAEAKKKDDAPMETWYIIIENDTYLYELNTRIFPFDVIKSYLSVFYNGDLKIFCFCETVSFICHPGDGRYCNAPRPSVRPSRLVFAL